VEWTLHALLGLHGWAAAAVVFALPMLEASTLLGLIIPGEVALIVGGVLANFGRLPLWAALTAGISGAVIGDSIGYAIGRHYGDRIRRSRLGRIIGPERWRRADRHLKKRGVFDVLVARIPPVLRTLVPGAAGMAKMPYGKFLAANVAGGVVWGTISILIGLLAGREWRVVEKAERWIGLAGLAGLMGLVVYFWIQRRRR
jgi:membrane protein DedA with SNARE-associated domain